MPPLSDAPSLIMPPSTLSALPLSLGLAPTFPLSVYIYTFISSTSPPVAIIKEEGLGVPTVDFPVPTQERTMDAQLGSHTVRSHGITVARTHVHDWLILMLLVAVDIILNLIHPFYRFVGKDMMDDFKYPFKDNTVPIWAVPIYSVLLPICIFHCFYIRKRDVYDLHHAILGLLFSVLITGVVTDALKDAIGRPRPDFFWRCFPDGKDAYDQWGDVICHGNISIIREGHKSFPSGHTSWSFAGLGFLSLYLSGKIKAFDHGGHVAKLCIVFLPLLVSSLVAVSRVDDYRHHWQDVFAGGLLGLMVAAFCYLQFFPPPNHVEGWGPYAYFRVLEESRATTQASTNMNSQNAQSTEARIESQCDERNNHSFTGISLAGDSSSMVKDLEAGMRGSNRLSDSSRNAYIVGGC